MAQILDQIFAPRDLRQFPSASVRLVLAMRLSVVFAKAGRDPMPDLIVRLRSVRAARSVERLVEAVNRVWPEPFAMHRPCCMNLSADEMLVADVAAAAERGDALAAISAMRDLLPSGVRDQLFRETIEVVDAVRCAEAQQTEAKSV